MFWPKGTGVINPHSIMPTCWLETGHSGNIYTREMINTKIVDFILLCSLGAQPYRLHLQCRSHEKHGFDSWIGNIPWRRKWQPAPVFLPGKFHGQILWNRESHKFMKIHTAMMLRRTENSVLITLDFL